MGKVGESQRHEYQNRHNSEKYLVGTFNLWYGAYFAG